MKKIVPYRLNSDQIMHLFIKFVYIMNNCFLRAQYPEQKNIANRLTVDSAKKTKLIKRIEKSRFVHGEEYLPQIIKLSGAQLSSRCLSIDGSSNKCGSILTYPKRHELSLDIW